MRRQAKKIEIKNAMKCGRCELSFKSMLALKRHSHVHLDDMQELRLLQEGHKPVETKFGGIFKGKNKVIIS
ncbi:MAG: hypothetical protein HYW26_00915 [Candidatus Aenigmarchaeota archaeon]|nr:hypothetical protein [Candidatus Aenigmarchaeota archaeon]